ncbi:MAG TPA: energy transducer TonB [Pyrinomonadaceae bacterium]
MKAFLAILATLIITSFSLAQSGRRVKPSSPPPPTPEQKPAVPAPTPAPAITTVTAEKNEDYRCTTDGSLARILESDEGEKTYLPKEVDTKALIRVQPEPKYTREARRAGAQGYVILKVLLSAKGNIDRVRVVRPLPFGLTENAIRAACGIKFDPAIKNGAPVSQWVTLEYTFRLARSSIFGP